MNTHTRYVMLIFTLLASRSPSLLQYHAFSPLTPQVSIHFIVSFTHEAYGRATSFSNIVSKFHSPGDYNLPDSFPVHPQLGDDSVDNAHRANATFVILCRNSDIHGAVRSIRSIEDRFNRKFRYPYVFLNEEPFTDEFKESVFP